MSRQIALDSIALRQTPRWGHTEYSMEYHREYLSKVTGCAEDDPMLVRRFYDAWDCDFLFSTDHGLHGDWESRGRATDMGHAVYAADGSDRRESRACPFRSPEDVWAFDPVSEYGLPDFSEQAAAFEHKTRETGKRFPNQLIPGGYYRTIVSGAIQTFGWEMLLVAASDIRRMEKVFDGFYRFTRFHMEAWAQTGVEVVIQHDDLVWDSGPFMCPDMYRKVIIPRYAELWKVLHAAGKKVLFCSDGNFMQYAHDIQHAGADGLIFEPSNDFTFMAECFGQSMCLIGSAVDCRDMTFRPWEVVKAQIDESIECARRCRGVVFAVGNHIPANVPDAMLDSYIGYLRKVWERS